MSIYLDNQLYKYKYNGVQGIGRTGRDGPGYPGEPKGARQSGLDQVLSRETGLRRGFPVPDEPVRKNVSSDQPALEGPLHHRGRPAPSPALPVHQPFPGQSRPLQETQPSQGTPADEEEVL